MATDRAINPRQAKAKKPSVIRRLELQVWRNWLLLATIAAATTAGLALALFFALWPWTAGEVALLVMLTTVVLVAVAHLTYEERRTIAMRRQMQKVHTSSIDHRYNRLYDLLTVTRLLDSDGDPESIFRTIPDVCLRIFDCDKASLMLHHEESGHLEVMSAAGYSDRKIIGARQKVGDGIAGWVAKHLKPVVLQDAADVKKYPGLKFKSRGVPAAIVVPIILGKKLLGILNMSSRASKAHYTDDDLRALEAFAQNAAVCIGQVLRARRMKDTIEQQQRELQKMYTGAL